MIYYRKYSDLCIKDKIEWKKEELEKARFVIEKFEEDIKCNKTSQEVYEEDSMDPEERMLCDALATVSSFCKKFKEHSDIFGKRSGEGYRTWYRKISFEGKKIAIEYFENQIPLIKQEILELQNRQRNS